MKRINIIANTLPYSLSYTNFAKLFKVFKHKYKGLTTSSGKEIRFKLYQVSEMSYIEKEYIISNSTNEVFTLWDLTPFEKGIELVYELKDEEYTFYVKGSLEQPVNMIVQHTDSIGCIEGFISSAFNKDIASITPNYSVIYKKEKIVSYQNNWVDHSNQSSKYYIINGRKVVLNIAMRNGTYVDGTVAFNIDNNLKPNVNKYFDLYGFDGSSMSRCGFARVNGNGEVQVYGITKVYQVIYGNIEYSY